MATVMQVAKAAFQEILVRESEADIEPDEYADFIFALNNFMADLAAHSVNLSYTTVSNVADTVTVADGAIQGIVACMAVKMAPQFSAVVTPELALKAEDGMKTLLKLGQTLPESAYPYTLPRGSGNHDDGWREDAFYPDQDSTIQA